MSSDYFFFPFDEDDVFDAEDVFDVEGFEGL